MVAAAQTNSLRYDNQRLTFRSVTAYKSLNA